MFRYKKNMANPQLDLTTILGIVLLRIRQFWMLTLLGILGTTAMVSGGLHTNS